jgi:hypothetical protein
MFFIAILGWLAGLVRKAPPPEPHWEAVPDDPVVGTLAGEVMWRVRWSDQDATGRWFYCRHYGGSGASWNKHAAERDAERLNEAGEKPWAMDANWKCK